MMSEPNRALKPLPAHSYFDTIITIDSTTEHKPKPEPVLKALSNLTYPQRSNLCGRFDS